MSFSFYIQSVEKVVLSTFCSLLRYAICSVPLMYLLDNTMGVRGIWIALVVADAITGIVPHRPCAERAEASEQAHRITAPEATALPIRKRRSLSGGRLFFFIGYKTKPR